MNLKLVLASFWYFLKTEKKYWLLPLALGFFALLLLVVLAESAPLLSPFLYTIF